MLVAIRRRSCEILADLAKAIGIPKISDRMRLAEITIRKWCERSNADPEDLPFEPSGRLNPLDRTADILRLMVTEGQVDLAVETINWLARELGGVFITGDEVDAMMSILAKVGKEEKQKRKSG